MTHKLPIPNTNIEVNIPTRCTRVKEFLDAVTYLFTTFPPSRATRAEIKFVKSILVTSQAAGDYYAVDFENVFDSMIRVAYGLKGGDPEALLYLFHEYKHLCQAADGYLYDPKYAHINHCIEAEAWAQEQFKIYQQHLAQ